MENTTPKVRSLVVRKTMSYMEEGEAAFNERQLATLVAKTPQIHIKSRKGRGGKTFSYVTGAYVQDRLNQVFGWAWSFEVKGHGNSPSGESLWVLGRLSVVDPKTRQTVVTKEQFGSSDIKFDKSGKETDYADDFKAATTDSLKKCASMLGIAADIYADPETSKTINDRVEAVKQYQLKKREQENQSNNIQGEEQNATTTQHPEA